MTTGAVSPRAAPRWVALGLLAALLSSLLYIKAGASLRAISAASANGQLDLRLDPYIASGPLAATGAYLRKVWVALSFGILLAGTLGVAVSPARVATWLGGSGGRSLLRGAMTGAPLMLCSCCVTPIFSGLHRRGAGLGPSLSVLFAAPALNVASLAITFVLFPAKLGWLRVGAALLIVFALAPLTGRFFEGQKQSQKPSQGEPAACPVDEVEPPLTFANLPGRWLGSVARVALMTLPIVLVGVAVSSFALPLVSRLAVGGPLGAVLVTSAVAVMVALPTFLEIPLAMALLAGGAPEGAAAALLIAGPVVNLPSLLVLAREVGWRVSLMVTFGVFSVASLAGLLVGGI